MDSRVEEHAVFCPLCRNSDIKPDLIDHDLLYTILHNRSVPAVLHDFLGVSRSLCRQLVRDIRDRGSGPGLPLEILDQFIITSEGLELSFYRNMVGMSMNMSMRNQTPVEMTEDNLLQISREIVSFFRLNCIFLSFDIPAELVKRLDSTKFMNLSYAVFQTIAFATRQCVEDRVYLRYSPEDGAIKGTGILPQEVVIDEGEHFGWGLAQFVAASMGCEITMHRNSEACVLYCSAFAY
jgi:hypothetical protein